MPGVPPVLGGVAVRLAVLNAQSHGEGLGLHGHAPAVEHLEGVPGGVAGGQDETPAGEAVSPLRAFQDGAGQSPIFRPQVLQPGLKADVRPQGGQLPAEVLEDDMEIVRAHMGLGVNEDVRRRAAGGQALQDEAVPGVLGAGVQLPVGEGPGPAFAKLDVGLQVQSPGGPEALHVRLAGLHGPAPLQEDGPLSGQGQRQGGEEPRGSRPHHDGGNLRRGPGRRGTVGRFRTQGGGFFVPAAAEDGGLVFHGGGQGVGQDHILPGVHAAAEDAEVPDCLRRNAQEPGGLGAEFRLSAAGGEADALKLDHGQSPFVGEFEGEGRAPCPVSSIPRGVRSMSRAFSHWGRPAGYFLPEAVPPGRREPPRLR